MYVDVVFPFRLKPLTYKVADPINHSIVGYIVKAPIQGRQHYGLVWSVHDDCAEPKNIKYISEICCHYADHTLISFLQWLSRYYITSEGLALKVSFFKEIVDLLVKGKKLDLSKPQRDTIQKTITNLPDTPISEMQYSKLSTDLLTSLSENVYRTVLIQSNRERLERQLLIDIVSIIGKDKRGIIVLAPEKYEAQFIYSSLLNIFGDRVVILHSNMRALYKRTSLERVLMGQSDIVVGTRSVIFTHLREVSLIVVSAEHSSLYKAEEGLRYNARDLAVMLGYLHNCPVILSSISPSIESIYNGRIKKYQHVLISDQSHCKIRPVVHSFKNQLHSALSREVVEEAKRVISRGGDFLFIGQREGFSLLYCKDCGTVSKCKDCGSSVIYKEDSKKVLCYHCKRESSLSVLCDYCKGYNIVPIGGGIERIKGEMELFLSESKGRGLSVVNINQSLGSLIIRKGVRSFLDIDREVDGAAIVDFDHILHRFGFRAQERAFQDVLKIASLVKQRGNLFIQTNNPYSMLLKALKDYNLNLFYDYELSLRRSAGYPPYKKLISMDIYTSDDFSEEHIKKVMGDVLDGVEILGPVELLKLNKGQGRGLRYIIRSSNKGSMNTFVKDTQGRLQGMKGLKMISIEVDPFYV